MSLSADDVVLECNIEILGRELPLLNRAWLEMQNMYASLAEAKYPDVNAFIESCELFGVIVVTNGYFERKGALEKWNAEQGQAKGEMGSLEEELLQIDGRWPNTLTTYDLQAPSRYRWLCLHPTCPTSRRSLSEIDRAGGGHRRRLYHRGVAGRNL